MEPEWRDVSGFEGLYQVSENGEVRRLPGMVTRILNGKEVTQRVPGKTLKPGGEYPNVGLYKDGEGQNHYVHVLVADAFLGPRPEGMQVCHNDGNPKNPVLGNLRYDTPTGNASDRHRHGTHAIGSANPGSKLEEHHVAQIKYDMMHDPGFSLKKAAAEWDVSPHTIKNIRTGTRWRHVEPQDSSVVVIYHDQEKE